MLSFQSSHCRMTLREGLCELYGSRDDLVTEDGDSGSSDFFRCHDVAHVVFGCSTTLTNEALVKIWSFFGTTAGLSLLRDYRSSESRRIYRQIRWRDIPRTVLRSAVHVPLVLSRCLRMRKRWPWSDFEQYLNVGLDDIRSEFGIRVVTVP
jgi:hypothetical protein